MINACLSCKIFTGVTITSSYQHRSVYTIYELQPVLNNNKNEDKDDGEEEEVEEESEPIKLTHFSSRFIRGKLQTKQQITLWICFWFTHFLPMQFPCKLVLGQ